ncbi:MAG: methyltransferase domain-containing protein [Phycisphaerales bacterium]|nr:methyltransferase domain-containing protein [Phycisphaerales bacterium]
MKRRLTPELMDAPGVDRAELDRALAWLRWANRRLGGVSALTGHLRRWSRNWPRRGEGVVTLLDVGCGSADIPVAVRRWGESAGFDVRVTALDLHGTTVDLAREHVSREGVGGVEVVAGDALRIAETFGVRSFDYCHAGLFLHHLSDVQVLTALAAMDRVARRGLVWNDLVRSRWHRALVEFILVGAGPIVRHDARVSVEAGFTRGEALDIALRLGLGYLRYRGGGPWYRFTMAGEKPGAWGPV